MPVPTSDHCLNLNSNQWTRVDLPLHWICISTAILLIWKGQQRLQRKGLSFDQKFLECTRHSSQNQNVSWCFGGTFRCGSSLSPGKGILLKVLLHPETLKGNKALQLLLHDVSFRVWLSICIPSWCDKWQLKGMPAQPQQSSEGSLHQSSSASFFSNVSFPSWSLSAGNKNMFKWSASRVHPETSFK